jgi:hypothetical protein
VTRTYVGDSAYRLQPDVGTEDEVARRARAYFGALCTRKSLASSLCFMRDGVCALGLHDDFLGTRFGDRFKAVRGGSRRFEEGCGGHKN